MFERILIPLDGSEIAELTLPYAEELARAFDSEITLYHSNAEEHRQQEHMHQVYLGSIAASVQNNIMRGKPNVAVVKVTTKVEVGDPGDNICNLVKKNNIGLIIMTSVSASGIKVDKMMGSVTDHICRIVPIPVLLIRPRKDSQQVKGEKRLINRILIPLDGSNLSKLSLPIGKELAGNLKAGITLYQMARMIRLYDDGRGSSLSFVNYAHFDEDEKTRVDAEMTDLNKELKESGLDVTHIVTSGFDAASEILEVGKKVGADIVVMSTHGRSGPGRWVFGSVAERVMRQGEIPLLLVNASTR